MYPGVGSKLRKRPQGKILRRIRKNCRRDAFSEIKRGEDIRRKWISVTETAEKTKKTGRSLELGNRAFSGDLGQSLEMRLES